MINSLSQRLDTLFGTALLGFMLAIPTVTGVLFVAQSGAV